MKILLTGASGAIGTHLLPQLHAAGHSVLGLVHSRQGAERVRALGAEAVIVDLLAQESVDAALEGRTADAIIHQATSLGRTPMRHVDLRHTNALRTRGTRNLLHGARALGARRFVTQSFLLGYGYHDHGSMTLDETHPFGRPSGSAFDEHLNALRVNEEQVREAVGIEGIALRYGLFYGDDRSTRRMRDHLLRRRLPVPSTSATTSLIHLEDAASCTVAALERGRSGHAYNVADDDPLPIAEFIENLADALGAPRPRKIPPWTLRPFPYARAFMVTSNLRMSAGRARAELGWAPRYPTVREGLDATAGGWNAA